MIQEIKMILKIKTAACSKYVGEEQRRQSLESSSLITHNPSCSFGKMENVWIAEQRMEEQTWTLAKM